MPVILRDSLLGAVRHAFDLINEFTDRCPDAVWTEKFGGWPIWQQCYHCFAAVNFFLRQRDDPAGDTLFPPAVANLNEVSKETPSRQTVKEFVLKEQDWVLRYAQALDDGALAEKNEGLSERMGRDMTHAGTLALIASHSMYHLGTCDAALRQRGLRGVF
ncbi:MAG: DinB family protein [Desulfovibrio sp.]|jgi:hypothetical protein|nr:DinB family protein [Desulfovibrio sp.]